MPFAVLGPRRRIGFGDEHVAVGQHVEPARMIEAGGERARRAFLRAATGFSSGAQPFAVATFTRGK